MCIHVVMIRQRALTLAKNIDNREDTDYEVKRLEPRLELEIHLFNPINQKSQTEDRALLDNINYLYYFRLK